MHRNTKEYKPLLDDKINNNKYDKIYTRWKTHLNRKLKPNYTTTILHDVPCHRVSDYVKVYNRILQQLGQTNNYKIYGKKQYTSSRHKIKAKPTNYFYQQRIMKHSLSKWEQFVHYIGTHNPQGMIVKRTNDKHMAEWYRDIIESEFFHNVVHIVTTMTHDTVPQFQVIINCNININIHKTNDDNDDNDDIDDFQSI